MRLKNSCSRSSQSFSFDKGCSKAARLLLLKKNLLLGFKKILAAHLLNLLIKCAQRFLSLRSNKRLLLLKKITDRRADCKGLFQLGEIRIPLALAL